MNSQNKKTKEMIKIMQSYAKGNAVYLKDGDKEKPVDKEPEWNWEKYQYVTHEQPVQHTQHIQHTQKVAVASKRISFKDNLKLYLLIAIAILTLGFTVIGICYRPRVFLEVKLPEHYNLVFPETEGRGDITQVN